MTPIYDGLAEEYGWRLNRDPLGKALARDIARFSWWVMGDQQSAHPFVQDVLTLCDNVEELGGDAVSIAWLRARAATSIPPKLIRFR